MILRKDIKIPSLPIMICTLSLLIVLSSLSPVYCDYKNSFVKPDCIPELNFFRFSIISVWNIDKLDWVSHGDKAVDEYKQFLEKKYAIYADYKPVRFNCKLKSYEIDTVISYMEPSDRGECGAAPGGLAQVVMNGQVIFKDLWLDNNCTTSISSFEFQDGIFKICAKDSNDNIRCIGRPTKALNSPLNNVDLFKIFERGSKRGPP